jgi:hypothetical protein
MAETRVAKHTFVYNGERYFRDKSEDIMMGTVGEKTDPVGSKAGLTVVDHVDRADLKGRVRYVTTADIDWSRQAKADVEVEGTLKYFAATGSAGTAFSYERAKSARLKLAKFVIDEGPLQTLLNTDADKARRILADERRGGRIVSTIWVVVEGRIAESFAAAGTQTGAIEVSALGAAKLRLAVKAKGGSSIDLEPGTTFAYLMHRVTRWNKDRTRVEELDLDSKGLH